MRGLLLHDGGQLAAEDGEKARVILNKFGIEQLAARSLALEEHGTLAVPAGVERSRQAGWTAADDRDVEVVCGHGCCTPRGTSVRPVTDDDTQCGGESSE